MNLTLEFSGISNKELLAQLRDLCIKERAMQSIFLKHLAEVDRRRLYADEGYSSLYQYVTEELGLSGSSALKRIQIARASVRHPEILTRLEQGRVSLTVLSKLCPLFDVTDAGSLLEKCEGLSVREVGRLLAPAFASETSPENADDIHAVSQKKSRIQFTAGDAFLEKLERAKDLLRAKYPTAKLEEVFGDALDLLVDSKKPERVVKRLSRHAAAHSRHIPVAVKATVWQRDRGRCTFVAESGHACAARTFLEYDHIFPWALGGSILILGV